MIPVRNRGRAKLDALANTIVCGKVDWKRYADKSASYF